ncbi:ABC transporter permease subunit [Klebsiella variicola subsp. variicola]|nr:ABC transporter permease subunit [Klebsiella variicola subsp. variicola]
MTLLITLCSLLWRGAGPACWRCCRSAVSRRERAGLFLPVAVCGTPVLFQIIFVHNVLPGFGLRFSAFTQAVLALSLNEGAYMAEICALACRR